jgi:3-hydroxy-9,10-secoandrosta-1,3,5(10)-triene-9,17-dione monooxygenase reductase component
VVSLTAVAAPTPDELRQAMAPVPTAVAVVTAPGLAWPSGATANAVTSLSLDPPLMLACLDRESRTLAELTRSRRFGICFLGAGDEELARLFATKSPPSDKWRDVAWGRHAGVPVLETALAWFACELREVHGGGDHEVAIGEVVELGGAGGDPLVFWAGRYRALGP